MMRLTPALKAMRYLLVSNVFLFMLSTTVQLFAESKLYIGCGGHGDQPTGIYSTTFDSKAGTFSASTLAAATNNPSYLATARNGALVFSVSEQKGGSVSGWRVEPDDKLSLINTQPINGDGPCHLSITPSGRVLLVANYSSGSVAAFKIQTDGSLSERTAFIQLTGSGPNHGRQASPHAHGIYCDPTEQFVYVCDLGTDRVWIFKLDSDAGTLVSNDPASVSLPPGSGPRHLAFGKNPELAYVNGEMGLNVSALRRDLKTGGMEVVQTIPAFSGKADGRDSTAEIVVHPSGRWLTLSTRGQDTLSTFKIESDGMLTFLETVSSLVKTPRSFAISPDGDWLIAAGQGDNQCVVQKIDLHTGMLEPTGYRAELPAPQCVLFVR